MAAPAGVGYLAVAIAVLFFGSNFVPVKRYDTGDGMFFQWVMASAIFAWGCLLQFYLFISPQGDDHVPPAHANGTIYDVPVVDGRTDPYAVKFIPYAVLGGALWATGNTLAVPVINLIGLGLALLIWGATNMLMGWATGVFGLFGTEKDHLENEALNYAGVSLAVVALLIFTQVKPSDGDDGDGLGKPTPTNGASTSTEPMLSQVAASDVLPGAPPPKKNALLRRLLGMGMAALAGILFGNNFTPVNYVKDNGLGPSQPMDYVFSHFTGIYLAATFWFIVYCIQQRSNPKVYPQAILPALVSGLMWAIAQTAWFVANDALSLAVAFPIITSGPGIVSSLWGVFVFKEIRGTRNLVFLSLAIVLSVAGCVMIGLSKA